MISKFIILGIFGLGGTEIALVIGVVLLLFGGKKIPEIMKGLGRGIQEFKKAKEEINTESQNIVNKDNNADG